MNSLKMKSLAALAAFALAGGAAALAQPTVMGVTVKGHVTDEIGQPVTKGEIRFTKDLTAIQKEQRFVNVTPIDANGNYEAKAVPPGDYFVYVYTGDISRDRQELVVKPQENATLDFDMTSERYTKDLTPERKKEIEDFKKNAAAAISANKVINNLNKTLANVRTDLAAALPTKADVSKDVSDMKAATDAKPDESVLWMVYGEALLGQADHLAAEDQKAGKPFMSDDDAVKLYTDSAAAYQKGVDINAASKKPQPVDQAVAYNSIGNIDGKLGKVPEAAAAYDNAVKQDPTKAGMYYSNAAITLFKANQADGAIAAADKAIAADPSRPDPYYIKASSLITKATVDPKTQLPVLPPGCLDAYQMFIATAPPTDRRVTEAKELLASLNIKIDTSYKAPPAPKKK